VTSKRSVAEMEKIDLLAIDDFDGELRDIIDWAILLKQDDDLSDGFAPLDGMTVGSIYEKPSTRTRVSFEVGISRLGGQPLTLLKNDIQLGKSESVSDTAAVLSRYMDGITYRCFEHSDVEMLADAATVPVINALSDKHHPCQAAADLMTVIEHQDGMDSRVAWIGDGNNVLHDLMLACAGLGIDITYAVPEGYEPAEDVVERSKEMASREGSKIEMTHDPIEAVSNRTVIYTDVFVSMGEEGLQDKMSAFEGFQVNEDLVAHADDDHIFMHCLPAHRGEEVTDGVIDSENSVVFEQAENRMWAQMSLLTRMLNPAAWEVYRDLF